MKILICYHSQTGNTEAVAKAMAEGLKDHDVTVSKAKDVDPTTLSTYDIVFLGSGVYAGAVGKPIKLLMKALTVLPPKMILFCTHANPDPDFYRKAFKKIEKQITDGDCKLCAQFHCIGENRDPKVVEMLIQTMPSMEGVLNAAKNHPDTQDLENAKDFAKSVIQEL